jgi:hypothetical protein
MALMQKMTLGSAAGSPGDGMAIKKMKMKAKNFKRKVKMKLNNLGDDIKRSFRGMKKGSSLGDKIKMNRNKKEGKNTYEGVIKGVSGTEKKTSEEQGESRGQYFKKRQPGERKYGKYSNPMLYKMETVGRNIKDKFEQMGMNIKENKGRKKTMADAAGPTKRNKDVMVCKEGQCQTR